ncbi:MAG: LacI family DNA-binding transcriptional regulator [Ktedonobacteraceae bacterium]
MVSIREVAERAQVSVGTVSNVLNRPELVAEETRRRVQLAIEETGFVRNGSARQLRAGRGQSIGLIVLNVANPFFTEVARGVEDACNKAGYAVILCNSDESEQKEKQYLRILEEQRVRGLLITPTPEDTTYLQHLQRRDIAIVLLDRPSVTGTMCSVAVDHVAGGELAVSHLLARGHTHLCFVHGPLAIRQYADRLLGAHQAIIKAGLNPDTAIMSIPAPASHAQGIAVCVEEILNAKTPPSAIFCGNDLLALGVMQGLTERGLSIPDDMALVGYDDVEFAALLAPALTSVRQPKYQLGHTAAELLLEEFDSDVQHEHRHVLYQPELVVRESS